MATYNGEKTIDRQLRSILKQLTINDEIIIIDDTSSDRTVRICQSILNEYPIPFTLEVNEKNLGPIFSFEKAISLAQGDYIYLSDQDDEWFDHKIQICQQRFKETKASLLVHDGLVVDGDFQILDKSWNHYNHNDVHQGIWGNLKKNGFTGAMMAFTKELKNKSLPFPKDLQMHDQWLFLVAKKNGLKVTAIEEPLMNYVRHGGNVTGMKKRSKKEMLKGRLIMLKCYMMKKKSEKEV